MLLGIKLKSFKDKRSLSIVINRNTVFRCTCFRTESHLSQSSSGVALNLKQRSGLARLAAHTSLRTQPKITPLSVNIPLIITVTIAFIQVPSYSNDELIYFTRILQKVLFVLVDRTLKSLIPALFGIAPQYIPSNSFISSSMSLSISVLGMNGPMLSTRTNLDSINNSIAGVVARFTTPPFLKHGEKGARSVAANASGAFRYILLAESKVLNLQSTAILSDRPHNWHRCAIRQFGIDLKVDFDFSSIDTSHIMIIS